jgi:pimeloyl-ACP methyl ester carboxylesterase
MTSPLSISSADGTRIAYETTGSGPALILVDGALCHRAFGPSRKLATALAGHFTVTIYDRRGRGDSGPGTPWALEREVEDLAGLIEAAGGEAAVFGISSGAALALEAADRLPGVTALAVYEPPFVVDPSGNVVPDDFVQRLEAADRPGALKLFMRRVGTPRTFTAIMPLLPMWSKLKAVAHTLPNDFRILGADAAGRPLPADRWPRISAPVLAMAGGKSPEWMRTSAQAVADVVGGAYATLPGQTHMVKPQALVPELIEFFAQPVMRTAGPASPRKTTRYSPERVSGAR